MKKLFVLFVLFASFAMAQEQFVIKKFTDLVTAVPQTKYVELGTWSQIDSVGLTLCGNGEVDIDSVVTYPGFKLPGGKAYYSSTAYTFLTDPDIAASTDFWTSACGLTAASAAATVLTSAVMRGSTNMLKVIVEPASVSAVGSVVYCVFRIWGTP